MRIRSKSSRSPAESPLPTATWTASLRRTLVDWFRREQRDLPWRRTRDPYRVWLSEVMLQQTQVATVVDYFHRFTAAFPTVADLAAAPEHDVLKLWEGLGYYRRARQLHRAAAVIVAEHAGAFPNDPVAIRALPGIGRYTAGAILSIAFDRPEPILEANTVRVLSRLAAFRGDPHANAGQEYLWSWAAALVPDEEPGIFNQALMELGALVCTPRAPRCDACPVAELCPTRRLGLQDEIPRPKAKLKFEEVHEAAIVVRHRDGRRVLLVQYAPGKRWANMWDFPRFEMKTFSLREKVPEGRMREGRNPKESQHRRDVPSRGDFVATLSRRERVPLDVREFLQQQAAAALGLKIAVGDVLRSLKYGVTRFRISLDAYEARAVGGRLKAAGYADARWVSPSELAEYPLSTSARKLAKIVAAGRRLLPLK